MDTLSRLLALYTIRTTLDVRCELAAPWVLDEPARPDAAPFHVVASGSARAEAPGIGEVLLGAGDIVVFAHGGAHRLHAGTGPGVPVAGLPSGGPLRRQGNADGRIQTSVDAGILCGSFVFDAGARRALGNALPPMMVVRGSRADDFPGLHALVRLLQHETVSTRPGGSAVVAQLSGALFALLMRAWLEGGEQAAGPTPGLFALLGDRRLGHALHQMLESPERAWTVTELAAACHMSRATFARLFTAVCGEAPAALLTRLRMARAAALLVQDRRAAGDVALAVGYQSEAAFHRAFKRHYGQGPGGFRRALG